MHHQPLFRDKMQYNRWVACNYIRPIASWKKLFPKLLRIYSPGDASAARETLPVVGSFGHGVAGSLYFKLAPALRNKRVIWLAASRSEKQALMQLLVRPSVFVVPYVLDEKLLRAELARKTEDNRRRFCAKHGLDPAIPVLFFSGRISPRKGIRHLVREIERQQFKVTLVLAGVWDSGAEDLRAFKAEVSAGKFCHVVDIGPLSPRKNLTFMNHADAVCALSTDASEDYGFLPRQALALGTPILITRWGGLRDIRLSHALDAKLIRRIPVKRNRTPDFAGVDLARFVRTCVALSGAQRRSAGREQLAINQNEIKSGLKKAFECLNNNSALPTRFKPLAYEMGLRAAEFGHLDPNVDYPARIQLSFMRG